MRTRRASRKSGRLSLLVGTLVLFGLMAHAQLDSDTGAGATGSNEPPPASGSANAPTPSGNATNTGGKKSAANGKRTSIDFEDELIEGQMQKPELFYLLQKRQFNYKRMIRLRENFLPEMRKTSEEIQRKGSGD